MDQHPTFIASRYISHQLQSAYAGEEPLYTVTGFASEEVRKELHFPAGGIVPVTRTWPASVAGQYTVAVFQGEWCHEGMKLASQRER